MKKRNLAIIPARGGSKRIVKKNIKLFLGKPIIAYAIEKAIKSNLFAKVMVSTDDPEIAACAIKYGAEVPFMRGEKSSNDYAILLDVIKEVVLEYNKKVSCKFDHICCILPTAVLMKQSSLKEAYQVLTGRNSVNCDVVLPVTPFSFPIQRSLVVDSEQKVKFYQERYQNVRSQDLDKHYHDCGQFYWMKTNYILEAESLISKNSKAVIVPELHTQDIDTIQDWEMAEFKYQFLKFKQ